jgi:hypothetical protein
MPTRGVIYMLWGKTPKVTAALQRSIASLKATNPDLPHTLFEIEDRGPWETLLAKASMLDKTPYDETLFLDADTMVMGPLDFGFEKAEQHGLACCICESPWLRRYSPEYGDLIEYNTGVIFFTKKAAPFFAIWKELAPKLPSQILLIGNDGDLIKMPYNDQCSFSVAVDRSGISPFVLPMNWNYRPPWQYGYVGPIRIWHSYDQPSESFIRTSAFYNKAKNPVFQYHIPDTPPVKPPEPKLDSQPGVRKV